MGYACPVCATPQRDGEHLANHLAFTAMTHGDDHETWLDDNVPEWSSAGPDELAPRVTELAEETPYETVFEDTVHDHAPGSHDHGHDQSGLFGDDAGTPGRVDVADAAGGGELDADARAVFEEAQALTRQMLESDDEEGDADTGSRADDADTDGGGDGDDG
jgi:hypothetical protein